MYSKNSEIFTFEYFKKRYNEAVLELKEKNKVIRKNYKINYIYFIKNNINKNIYIGRSIYSVEYRFKQHIDKSKSIKSDVYNIPLYKALREYGELSFSIGYLDCIVCHKHDYKKANDLEQSYIKEAGTLYPNGYNISGLKGKDLKKWRVNNG